MGEAISLVGFRVALSLSMPEERILVLEGDFDFGEVSVGTTAARELAIANKGNADLMVSGLSLPDGFSGDWSGVISAGSTQSVSITFAPQEEQSYAGELVVSSDATSGANTLPVSAIGVSALVAAIQLQGDLNYGGVLVGEEKTRVLLIENFGGADLVVGGISLPEGFRGDWEGTIGPSGEQEVTITFEPEATWTYSGNLVVDIGEVPGENTAFIHGYGMPAILPEGMVFVPGGTNAGVDPDIGAYSLTVNSFYMDKFPVTKALWDEVYSWAIVNGYSFDNVGDGKAGDHPVHMVNWYDTVKWCNARSEKEGLTPVYTVAGNVYRTGQFPEVVANPGLGYRLPRGNEREYAARGGLSGKRFPWGDEIHHGHANYLANGARYSYDVSPYTTDTYHPTYSTGAWPHTSPVGSFAPNGYGLFDMSGNVEERCFDGLNNGELRLKVGGSFNGWAGTSRVRNNIYAGPPEAASSFVGFRAVRSMDSP